MPRRPRACPPGLVYHVLNRGVGRMTLFEKPQDYEAFERVMLRTAEAVPGVELFAYCLMPNHWHLLLRPRRELGATNDTLSTFMRLLTVTHTQRWHAHHHSSGTGPVYQGRFKSFPIETESYFLAAARYVERNPLRAGLVPPETPPPPETGGALGWRWSSLWARRHGSDALKALLTPWPTPPGPRPGPGNEPTGWLRKVNRPQSRVEEEALGLAIARSRPLGRDAWVERTASRLGLESTLRPRGRPRKSK